MDADATRGFIVAGFIVLAYLLPSFIAVFRGHRNQWPIFLTNLIFGVTGIVWVICLIWSTSCNTKYRDL